ncbi:hypothetical protein FNV43_RR23629 [Rhamnella rubrinervis]|uniref:Uncharacterized protein n=1 Tax=Rhamnella rubrinervis TaxID=2594499 RepID=A0A8K0E463_9ROSA|nr:hypothetical protein FNV43_RR23629 [Rhamnella rubrinervis]
MMEVQTQDANLNRPQVKVTFGLGSETYSVEATKGILSEQLVYVKDQSMGILKDFIIRNNALNDVPDEPADGSSEEEDEILEKPQVKSKKTKTT